MIKKSVAVIFLALFLSGCVTHQKITYTGGNKAEGIVKLSYGYRLYQNPNMDSDTGRQIALSKCQSWGYTDVSQPGKKTSECIRQSNLACSINYVTVDFQCIGKK